MKECIFWIISSNFSITLMVTVPPLSGGLMDIKIFMVYVKLVPNPIHGVELTYFKINVV